MTWTVLGLLLILCAALAGFAYLVSLTAGYVVDRRSKSERTTADERQERRLRLISSIDRKTWL